MEDTMLIHCTCKSEFQDRVYGKNIRVANKTVKGGEERGRCTICGAEKSVKK